MNAERKRPPNAGKGRRKGVPNKATANAREAIALFVDGNADRLQGWLDEIAEKDGPRAAFECFKDLLEYHVPKLSRSEVKQTVSVSMATMTDAELEQLIRDGRSAGATGTPPREGEP